MTPTTAPKSYLAHARDLLFLGIPLMITHVMSYGLHLTDVLFAGRYSVEAGAALVLAHGYWFVLFILLAGPAFAVMPMVAKANAQDDPKTIRRATRMSIWLAAFLTVLAFPMFFWGVEILLLLGQDPALLALARPYLLLVGIEMFPALVLASLRSYFSALELTKVLVVLVGAALGLNAFLDWVLIFGTLGAPELGVTGAALSSFAVSTLVCVGLFAYAQMKTPENALLRNPFKSDWSMLAHLLKIGLPIGMTSLAEVSLFNFAAIMMGWIGTVALAAHGFALQVAAIAFMFQLGLAQAGTVLAGNALGRADEVYLQRGAIALSVMSASMAVFLTAIFLIIPEPLIAVFMSPDDPAFADVLALGVSLLFLAGLMQLSDGGQVIILSLLRGLQDTTVPLGLAVVSYWGVGVATSYVLGFVFDLGARGIWIGFIVGLSAAWLLLGLRFLRVKARVGLR